MKPYQLITLLLASMLLAACNFTLASDITPPPDYVSPTPMPTLGALYPASAPDVQNGAALYAQNCAACHGDKGLGDGPQSMQLPVTVPGIGLAQVARPASPADWFKVVTQGNLDRFMPPFVGALSDDERWAVISYALTLHTTPDQIAQGKSLFEAGCPDCSAKFTDQTKMAALSEDDLVRIMRNGQGDIPAFGKNYTDDQAYAVAAYLRTLTFSSTAQTAALTTPTPGGNGKPAPTTAAGTPAAGTGVVAGSVQLDSGTAAGDLTVTLHGFDHAQDQTSGPQEVLTQTTTTDTDGSYRFTGIGLPINRIFLAEITYAGIQYRTAFVAVQAGQTELDLPQVKLYDASQDASLLTIDQVHIYTDFATAGTVQVLEIFAFSNSSDKSIVISTDGNTIPFIKLPAGAQNAGYEVGQTSAPFVTAGKGIAVVPNDTPYSIIAFFNLPYDKKLQISQPFGLDAPSVLLLVPEGMKVEGSQLSSKGQQVIQNNNYEEYSSGGLKAGDSLDFTISGAPRLSSATVVDPRQIVLYGGGAVGVLLILAGAFLYFRDRKREQPVSSEAEFESADEVMDAMLALDDLQRGGKITGEAYQKRRDELKEILRNLS